MCSIFCDYELILYDSSKSYTLKYLTKNRPHKVHDFLDCERSHLVFLLPCRKLISLEEANFWIFKQEEWFWTTAAYRSFFYKLNTYLTHTSSIWLKRYTRILYQKTKYASPRILISSLLFWWYTWSKFREWWDFGMETYFQRFLVPKP